jgi:hypothetical protein
MIYRIGEVLSFKTDSVSIFIDSSVFANAFGQKSRRIKLHTFHVSVHFQSYAGLAAKQLCSGQVGFIQHKIVVKTAAAFQKGMAKTVSQQRPLP